MMQLGDELSIEVGLDLGGGDVLARGGDDELLLATRDHM